MAANRRLVIVAVAAALVCVAVATWVLLTPEDSKTADCKQVHDMLEFSTAGMEQLTQTALEGGDNPDAAVAAYGERAQTMRDMTSAITDPDLRGTSQQLVDLDAKIIKTWADTVAVPQPAGADSSAATNEFTQAYRDYDQEHNRVVAELSAACPEAS